MNVEIEIELLAQTRVNYTAVRRWLEKMNVSPDGVEATIDMITAGGDAAGLVALAAKQCYMAFEPGLNPNVSRVRSEIVGYLENILKSGHGCYDGETEVLTSQGWIAWPDVKGDEVFACYVNGQMQWHRAQATYLGAKYTGPMISFEGSHLSLMLTPNHRVLVAGTDFGDGLFNTVEAEKLCGFGDRVYTMICSQDTNSISMVHGSCKRVASWTGRVYCVQVPGGLLYVRRNGHQVWCGNSVLEHAVFSFGITGVSRVFTGEMNRHRAGWAISERSGRFIRFGEGIPWWCPPSIRPNPLTDEENDELSVLLDERGRLASESGLTDLDPTRSARLAELEARVRLEELKLMTRDSFGRQFDMQAHEYAHLVSLWDLDSTDRNFEYKKKITSLLRRPIGMGYAGGGVWTGNARALRHVLALRTSEAAEEEIAYVFSQVAAAMVKSEPALFGDFKLDATTGAWVPAYSKV